MTIWQIILIICGTITAIAFIFVLIGLLFLDDKKFKDREWWMLPVMFFFIPIMILWGVMEVWDYLSEIWHYGGFRRYYQLIRERKAEAEANRLKREAEKKEYERIRAAHLAGEITKQELPRKDDGVHCIQFDDEMALSVDFWAEVRELVYVENEYNDVLNDFFLRHKDLRLYHKYKFIYLPNYNEDIKDTELLHYLAPNCPEGLEEDVKIDSTYPIKYVWYPEDAAKIKHGMMFFLGGNEFFDYKYIKGFYYPLTEGTDEEIIAQLDAIVKRVHDKHSQAGLYSMQRWEKPEIEEGSTDEYADALCPWVVTDDEVAGIAEEIRERVAKLREMGIGKKFIASLFEEKPKLSRLVVTKDLRIILPDYHNMEIRMEPINKAVYLLFLRHPEGIIFKHLPDYRKELAEIYQMIKPLGLNDRAIRSIEDVTNPCLNSINEKCARIRGAFVSQFDEKLANKYYILGLRGEAKKIELPRELVVWE